MKINEGTIQLRKQKEVIPMDIQLSDEISSAYLAEVRHILENKTFLSLSSYTHHHWTNRLMHSVNVSYFSWKIAKFFGCDEKAAARAGLLHDFCPYDFHAGTPTGEWQAFYHPKQAAKNSHETFGVTDRERDAILTHMFPLGPVPKNKEAWIITLSDKLCAICEVCHIAIALARRDRVVVLA